VTEVQGWLKGEGPPTHLPQRPAPRRVPVYVAALTSRVVEQAAELADGIMPLFWSTERVAASKVWIARGRARAPQLGPLHLTLGLPTFIGDDLEVLRNSARQNPILYTFFPFFQRLFRTSGFTAEADEMERGVGAASLSDRLLERCA
jgi:alkanesulfonate monooxygenase SsuD/methylene tetrahydromethanopterin reductase-like flavin-dependent oxidoreductase (luciferase family)